MGFGSMIHRSVTGELRRQDQVPVEAHLIGDATMKMNPDGTCDINGSVDFSQCGLKSLTQITPRIRNVNGSFYCGYNELTSLEGCPEKVAAMIDFSHQRDIFTVDDVRMRCKATSYKV